MKKLLLGLACAASLGLWMSCSDSNELDVTTHERTDSVTYYYAGTVTATRYVYKPVELGTTEPTSGKYYFINTSWDNERNPVSVNKYFHNAWVADKTTVTDDVATMRWTTDSSGETQTNIVTYRLQFSDNSISHSEDASIKKSGNTYFTNGTVIALTAGALDGTTFTIKELPYSSGMSLPDEDEDYYYNQYNNQPSYYDRYYVSYGNITYTRGQ